jgi:hypothetical protein
VKATAKAEMDSGGESSAAVGAPEICRGESSHGPYAHWARHGTGKHRMRFLQKALFDRSKLISTSHKAKS